MSFLSAAVSVGKDFVHSHVACCQIDVWVYACDIYIGNCYLLFFFFFANLVDLCACTCVIILAGKFSIKLASTKRADLSCHSFKCIFANVCPRNFPPFSKEAVDSEMVCESLTNFSTSPSLQFCRLLTHAVLGILQGNCNESSLVSCLSGPSSS